MKEQYLKSEDGMLNNNFPIKDAKPFEEKIKEMGFEDEWEFYKTVRLIDISTNEKLKAFKKWQLEDGSKEGLLKLIRKDKVLGE